MAKKNKNKKKKFDKTQDLAQTLAEEETGESTVAEEPASTESVESKKERKQKKKDKKKKDDGKPGFGERVGRTFKEMGSELKKVTWPSGKKTLAQTGIVISVVLIFLLILGAFDSLLTFLLDLLIKG